MRVLVLALAALTAVEAFAPISSAALHRISSAQCLDHVRPSRPNVLCQRATTLRMSAEVATENAVADGLMDRERYIVFNRFNSREGKGPKFEKRWADRKSSLKTLEGFRFFQLLRRDSFSGSIKYEEGEPDYMSMTVWETKKNFNSWRTGYAFKEAHGGGTIGGFLSAIVGSAMVLKGPPAPAMWDALLPIAVSPESSPIELKGRGANGIAIADGKAALPAETFVAMNRFRVKEGQQAAFEKRWAARESILAEQPGFFGFYLMRRDGGGKAKNGGAPFADESFNYSTCTVWGSKAAFEVWRDGPSKSVHAKSQSVSRPLWPSNV